MIRPNLHKQEPHLYSKVKLSNHWALDEFLMVLDKCAIFFAHKFRWPGSRKSLGKGGEDASEGQIVQSSSRKSVDEFCSKSTASFHLRVMMPYTSEEDGWLRSKILSLDEAYASVSIGEEIFSEYVKV